MQRKPLKGSHARAEAPVETQSWLQMLEDAAAEFTASGASIDADLLPQIEAAKIALKRADPSA